jgi:hypothetical protein
MRKRKAPTPKGPRESLSASKIKTLQGCSWLFWSKYHLKLPDRGNLGSSLGWVAHLLFECLGNPRHKHHYDAALKTRNIYKSPSIKRLVKKHFKRLGVTERQDAVNLNSWVLAGLRYDFFGKNIGRPTESLDELRFEITCNEDGKSYKILGFIDKLFLYKKKSIALIRDFKTSKKSFDGKDLEDNIQHQMYALAVRRLYPDFLKVKVEFPFLQLMANSGDDEKHVIKMDHITDEELNDFECLLSEIQKVVDSFTEKDAVSSLAIYKGFPTDGSFSGKLLCGFGKREGELKKDGTLKWGCGMKWPFEYLCVRKKDGSIKKSYFLDDAGEINCDESLGEYTTLEKYDGCPAWRNK